jgi:predicted Ser/Thr protein kinase
MKTFKKIFENENKMKKEIYFLERLSVYEYFPKVINIEEQKKELEMSFCGEALDENEDPKLWKNQIKKIIKILEKESIYHNDMHDENFLNKDGKIFLIDFGQASEDNEAFPFLNVSSSCVDSCNSFFHFFIKAEQNFKRRYRI